ncbi:hypothetical protein BV20DRAFT_1058216 [Pilatotrama ljubarskyi]|nr:hypothetical protein BV20DRAFT_1058216 [Pilatotrama ljubarskyi]
MTVLGRHALPMEVIRIVLQVLEYAAASDKSVSAKLCLVCHTVRSWILPVLYDRVVLSSAQAIERFAYAQMENSDDKIVKPAPATVVRKLWIGPTSSVEQNDLSYGSSSWPITLIHQILVRCPALDALALVNLYQGVWYRLAGVIPRGLQSLCLGPVHGKVDWRYLPCAPSLREFITMDTYMMDEEIQQIVLSPSIRRIRRLYSHGDRVSLAFDQLQCVEKATALEKLEIVCCEETEEEAAAILDRVSKSYVYEPARVALIPRSHIREGRYDPISVLYQDWLTLTKT